jgi:hypothetical protein
MPSARTAMATVDQMQLRMAWYIPGFFAQRNFAWQNTRDIRIAAGIKLLSKRDQGRRGFTGTTNLANQNLRQLAVTSGTVEGCGVAPPSTVRAVEPH